MRRSTTLPIFRGRYSPRPPRTLTRMPTLVLYRPVGPRELALIEASGWREFRGLRRGGGVGARRHQKSTAPSGRVGLGEDPEPGAKAPGYSDFRPFGARLCGLFQDLVGRRARPAAGRLLLVFRSFCARRNKPSWKPPHRAPRDR